VVAKKGFVMKNCRAFFLLSPLIFSYHCLFGENFTKAKSRSPKKRVATVEKTANQAADCMSSSVCRFLPSFSRLLVDLVSSLDQCARGDKAATFSLATAQEHEIIQKTYQEDIAALEHATKIIKRNQQKRDQIARNHGKSVVVSR
jgi:hypothetical protein